MNTQELLRLGVPLGEAQRRAVEFISKFILGGGDKTQLRGQVVALFGNPEASAGGDPQAFVEDDLRGEFPKALLKAPPPPRVEPVKYRQWGTSLEHEAVLQME